MFPAQAQEAPKKQCIAYDVYMADAIANGFLTEIWEGPTFEKFIVEMAKRFGPPPSGHVPAHGVVITNPAQPTAKILMLVLVNEAGDVCDALTARGELHDDIIQRSRGTAI